jgi:hypothetical protein
MINFQSITADDIERIALLVLEGLDTSDDIAEIIGMYLESTPSFETLSPDDVENPIITIVSKGDSIRQQ